MSGGMEEAAQELLMAKLEAQDDGLDIEPIEFIPDFEVPQDTVYSPTHYTKGEVECIDAITSAVVSLKGAEAVYVSNVIKYVWRYKHKNGVEDLQKARWYLNKLIQINE